MALPKNPAHIRLTLINVGTSGRPANEDNVKDVEASISAFLEKASTSLENPTLIPIVVKYFVDALLLFVTDEGRYMMHIKVGTDDCPATGADIEAVKDKIQKVIDDKQLPMDIWVTHHGVEVSIVSMFPIIK